MYMRPVTNRKAERYQLSELDCIITRSSRKMNVIYQKRSDNATVILTTKQCLNNRMMEHMYQVKENGNCKSKGLLKLGGMKNTHLTTSFTEYGSAKYHGRY